jgi:hypothetical protein
MNSDIKQKEMKKILPFIIALFLPLSLFAQDITYAEYFIDTDPGFGEAVSIPISAPGADLTLSFTAGLQALDPGIHQIFLRAKDDSEKWGPVVFNTFFMVEMTSAGESDIQEMEYFIDTDPGFGEAISVPVTTPGTDLSFNITADLTALDPGIHQIFFRGKNGSGKWGSVVFNSFFLFEIPAASESNIQQMEYFIDTDPGFGNATSIPVPSPGTDLSFNITADLTTLDPGMHQIYLRGKNGSGKWGSVSHGTFIIVDIPASGASQIQALEYFIDTDPGYGAATQVSLTTTGTDLEVTFDVSLLDVTVGDHVLYVRAKNELGQWGSVFIEAFIFSSDGGETGEIQSLYKLYPNPASRQITIEITDEIQNPVPIKIIDLNGAVVFEAWCNDHPCILEPDLPAGLYLISIEIEEHTVTQKIILK